MLWRIWRWRLEASTTSMSMMPSVPTPGAAGAVDDHRAALVGDLPLHLELQEPPGDEHRPGDRALVELVGLPHVEEGDPAPLLLRLLGCDLADLGLRGFQKFAEVRHLP